MNKSRNTSHKAVPVRAKNAVNKSIKEDKDKRGAKSDAVVKAEDDRLDEIFQNQLHIAVAMLPAVTFKHSKPVRKWITKLFDPSIPKSKRNSFMAFLLFQMQNMKIFDPFDKPPVQNLPDPAKLMTAAKWRTFMKEAETGIGNNFSFEKFQSKKFKFN